MASVNKAIILGNLGQDPEVKYLPSGDAVCNLSIATTEKWTDKASGDKKESTEWHRITIFGKLAKIAGDYLRKGTQVYIEGRITTRKWTDKAGVERYTTDIVASDMKMLGKKQGGDQDDSGSQSRRPQQSETGLDDMGDLDIPF